MPKKLTKKECDNLKNKNEIIWNVVNCSLAFGISFFSALIAAGELTWRIVIIALSTALVVAFVKFKNYWDGEKKEYSSKMFKFL